jgi:activator of HSP90 ATPase
MKESLEIIVVLNTTPENLFKAWLDSSEHSKFTGSKAVIDPSANGKFSAWDGYIKGTTVALDPYHKIVQKWRTTEFNNTDEDSMLELIFEKQGEKTKLTLRHYAIPEGQADEYRKGWEDFYVEPMQQYYNRKERKSK